jgi:hypothetical protein
MERAPGQVCSTDMELALAMSGLGRFEMWVRYLALGGQASPLELDAFFNESLVFGHIEHNILSMALNERLIEVGLSPLLSVPEADPEPGG